MGKEKYRELDNMMKDKYNLAKNKRGYDVVSINNDRVCFIAKTLASKVLRKCHPNKVPATVITTVD